jgi:predicted dehydrogenase
LLSRLTLRRISCAAFHFYLLSCFLFLALSRLLRAKTLPTRIAFRRAAIVGLVHEHVQGFLEHSLHNPEIEIVGIAEPDRSLASQYATRYGFDSALLFSDLEEMLERKRPQAVLVYTNTYDHRRVVETCARHGVHVMMEKPLAVSLEDALAIEKASQIGKIQVLVNYETTWYASNRAAYDLVHEKALGPKRRPSYKPRGTGHSTAKTWKCTARRDM